MLFTPTKDFVQINDGQRLSNDMVYNALLKQYNPGSPAETPVDPIEQIDWRLWQLVCRDMNVKAYDAPAIQNVLGVAPPFSDFTIKTWALLHLALAGCPSGANVIVAQLLQWLMSDLPTDQYLPRLNACLFILSQPEFAPTSEQLSVMMNLICRVGEPYHKLAVLSSFRVSDRLSLWPEDAFSLKALEWLQGLHDFDRQVGLQEKQRQCLVFNLVDLDVVNDMASLAPETIRSILHISSALDINQSSQVEVLNMLVLLGGQLISRYTVDLSAEDMGNLDKKSNKFRT